MIRLTKWQKALLAMGRFCIAGALPADSSGRAGADIAGVRESSSSCEVGRLLYA